MSAFEYIEELEMKRDGSTAYRYGAGDVSEAAAGSWESANREGADIEWTCGDDLDEPDDDHLVMVEAAVLAELVRMARLGAQYAGCSGCRRVTLV